MRFLHAHTDGDGIEAATFCPALYSRRNRLWRFLHGPQTRSLTVGSMGAVDIGRHCSFTVPLLEREAKPVVFARLLVIAGVCGTHARFMGR